MDSPTVASGCLYLQAIRVHGLLLAVLKMLNVNDQYSPLYFEQ